jgi:Divergent InlB B-repeat domain
MARIRLACLAAFAAACGGAGQPAAVGSVAPDGAVGPADAGSADAGTPTQSTVTVSVAGHGTGTVSMVGASTGDCTSTCSIQTGPGGMLELTAKPSDGSRFLAWKGCPAADGATCSLATVPGAAAVSANFELIPVPPATCAQLTPTARPAAPTVFSVPVRQPGDDTCEPGTSDGSGVILVHYNYDFFPGGSDLWTVKPDASGSTEFRKSTFVVDLVGEQTGFEGGTWFQNFASIALFTEQGVSQTEDVLSEPSMPVSVLPRTVTDPGGGILVANADFGSASTLNAQSYTPAAALRWSFDLPAHAVVAGLGTDTAGYTLVVWQLESDRPFGPLTGQWIDPLGNGGPSFAFDIGSVAYALYPLVEGGFFVQRFTALASDQVVTDWRGKVDSNSTLLTSAPDWLVKQSAVAVKLIHGRSGYAVTPLIATPVAPCAQQLSIVDASGNACGSFSFPIAAESCTPAPLTIGVDGTVIAQLPTDLEKTDPANRPSTCTWQWWSGFLK